MMVPGVLRLLCYDAQPGSAPRADSQQAGQQRMLPRSVPGSVKMVAKNETSLVFGSCEIVGVVETHLIGVSLVIATGQVPEREVSARLVARSSK